MKKYAFYLLIAFIAVVEFMFFLWALGTGRPFPFIIGLFLGIAVLYIARLYVDEVMEDERSQKITQQTALTTLQISWIALLAFSLWMIIEGAGQPPIKELRRLGIFGLGLLLVNAGMIAVFILLSFYYRKQYGE
jgi:uncharacterized membrane protein